MKLPNPAHALDAATAICLDIEIHWPDPSEFIR
jgi:hypothetical protein